MTEFSTLLEEFSTGEDDDEPEIRTKRDAVEYLDREIRYTRVVANNAILKKKLGLNDLRVTVPFPVAQLLSEAASKGMLLDEGKSGVRLRRIDKRRRLDIYLFAKEIKLRLRSEKMPAREAETRAAEEARDYGRDRFGDTMAVSTIKRGLGWRP